MSSSAALRAFIGPLQTLSPYQQAGLVLLTWLTPNSDAIRALLRESLSHYQRFDRWFRTWIAGALAVELILIAVALMSGPFQGVMATVMIGLISATALGFFVLLPATMEAKSFVVTTYRHRSVYEAIKQASRNPALYVGRLGHSARLLTGLPGNVRRPLDGIKILGCMSDLCELSDLNPNRSGDEAVARRYHQFDDIEDTSHILGMAYGAIAETFWSQSRLISALVGRLMPRLAPATLRSDSGSLFYELFLHRDSIQARLLPALLVLMIFNIQHALIVAGVMAGIAIWNVIQSARSAPRIVPGSYHWDLLKKHLVPFAHSVGNDRKNLVSAEDRQTLRDVRDIFRNNRPISLIKLRKVLAIILRISHKNHTEDFQHELLFFTYWEHETDTPASGRTLSSTAINRNPGSSVKLQADGFDIPTKPISAERVVPAPKEEPVTTTDETDMEFISTITDADEDNATPPESAVESVEEDTQAPDPEAPDSPREEIDDAPDTPKGSEAPVSAEQAQEDQPSESTAADPSVEDDDEEEAPPVVEEVDEDYVSPEDLMDEEPDPDLDDLLESEDVDAEAIDDQLDDMLDKFGLNDDKDDK